MKKGKKGAGGKRNTRKAGYSLNQNVKDTETLSFRFNFDT